MNLDLGPQDEAVQEQVRRYLTAHEGMRQLIENRSLHDLTFTSSINTRTGLHTALAEHAGLVKLLIAKGVLTPLDYFTAIAEAMEDEVATLQDWQQRRYPPDGDHNGHS